MTKFWHPDTGAFYSARDIQARFKIGGITPGDCEKYGFFVPVSTPRPDAAANMDVVEAQYPQFIDGAWTQVWDVVPRAICPRVVDAERDRRINAGFAWGGKQWQSDPDSRENINGAYSSALAYLMSGGSADEVYWSNPNTPLTWLAEDNSLVTMTPAMMIDFGNAALAHKKAHIFAGRSLKDTDPIPADFVDDKWWP